MHQKQTQSKMNSNSALLSYRENTFLFKSKDHLANFILSYAVLIFHYLFCFYEQKLSEYKPQIDEACFCMPVSHSQNVVNLFFLRNEISSEELLLKTNNNHLKVTRLIGILCGFSYSVKKTQANNNIHVFNVHVEKSTSSGSLYQKM